MNYDWNFGKLVPYLVVFVRGAITSITLSVFIIFIGTLTGIILGLLVTNKKARLILYPFIDIIRALPPLVLVLFMYYFLTRQIIGFTVSSYGVCVISMSLNLAAFTSDIVRASYENVPTFLLESGLSLGFSKKQLLRHIIFPHIIRETLPSMTMLYISMLKMTSLASIVNVNEIVYTANTVTSKLARSLEAWVIVAIIYIVLVVPSTYFARLVEKKIKHADSSVLSIV